MGAAQPFGPRLAAAMAEHGPLCVGIDPHAGLLGAWGLPDSVEGLERFAATCVEAFGGQVACVKPQSAFFERFGSRGVAVLEATLAGLRDAGTLSLLDVKRGDIGSTMGAYADAYLDEASPLRADAITVSPYLGYGSLRPALDLAAATGRGVFVLTLTSNPEGAAVQHARSGGLPEPARWPGESWRERPSTTPRPAPAASSAASGSSWGRPSGRPCPTSTWTSRRWAARCSLPASAPRGHGRGPPPGVRPGARPGAGVLEPGGARRRTGRGGAALDRPCDGRRRAQEPDPTQQ
ncbi:hypothetical protein GCM10025862_12890 [Arsenicicoccus piscis]|uniref:Orotidine-5'-phosphate decarboxylase n=1 Tax=Arsenicicoccus piscis TaxID=673954 RepID=A0ABQ6HNM3_9MICO|nr:hypothetical protein GCM10025862_12890 [Arsenicicoccus piscis]